MSFVHADIPCIFKLGNTVVPNKGDADLFCMLQLVLLLGLPQYRKKSLTGQIRFIEMLDEYFNWCS